MDFEHDNAQDEGEEQWGNCELIELEDTECCNDSTSCETKCSQSSVFLDLIQTFETQEKNEYVYIESKNEFLNHQIATQQQQHIAYDFQLTMQVLKDMRTCCEFPFELIKHYIISYLIDKHDYQVCILPTILLKDLNDLYNNPMLMAQQYEQYYQVKLQSYVEQLCNVSVFYGNMYKQNRIRWDKNTGYRFEKHTLPPEVSIICTKIDELKKWFRLYNSSSSSSSSSSFITLK